MCELVFEADYLSQSMNVPLNFDKLYKAMDRSQLEDRQKFIQYVFDCIKVAKAQHLKLSIYAYEKNVFDFTLEAEYIYITKKLIQLIYYNKPWVRNCTGGVCITFTVLTKDCDEL